MPKTIFGTTEKSNFILNMKKTTLQKWIGALLIVSVVLPQLFSFICKLTGISSALVSIAVYATGFMCILFYIIVMLKKELIVKENPSHIIAFVLAGLTLVAYIVVCSNIYSSQYLAGANADALIKTMLIGEDGRYEGIATLLVYIGFFLLATAVPSEKTICALGDVFIGTGLFQCVIAVLQHIPNLNILTEYSNLATVALKNVMLSSGLEESPIFFGTYLTILFGAAVNGALYSKSSARAWIYGITAVFAVVTGLFTSSIVPIIGIGCAFAASAVIAVIKKVKFEKGVIKSSLLRLAAITGAIAAAAALICVFQGIYIRDKAIAYEDAFYRLFIVGSYSPVNKQSLYEIGWGRSLYFIKGGNPLFGIGPDCFAKVQSMLKSMATDSIDKSYNEYLYVAVTRGLLAFAAYAALLGYVFVCCVRGIKKFAADSSKWYYAAFAAIVFAYSVQAFFSASTIAVSPLIWMIMGFACAKNIECGDNPFSRKKSKQANKAGKI